MGRFSQKRINNLQRWTKLFRQNRKSIFLWKNPLPNPCCSQSSRLLATKLGQIQHSFREVKGKFWNLKNWAISLIYCIFNFCLNKFCPGLYLHSFPYALLHSEFSPVSLFLLISGTAFCLCIVFTYLIDDVYFALLLFKGLNSWWRPTEKCFV